eukprot:3141835-Pyramimonas_sp.AAC.1
MSERMSQRSCDFDVTCALRVERVPLRCGRTPGGEGGGRGRRRTGGGVSRSAGCGRGCNPLQRNRVRTRMSPQSTARGRCTRSGSAWRRPPART